MKNMKTLITGLTLNLQNPLVGHTNEGNLAYRSEVNKVWFVNEVNGWDAHLDSGTMLGPYPTEQEAMSGVKSWNNGAIY